MFPPNHSLNGLEPSKSSSGSNHGVPISSSAEFAFHNFSLNSSLQTSAPGTLHTTPWMSANQGGLSSKPWQGESQPQPHDIQHDSQKSPKESQQNDLKHREYLKQQQRLKAMQISTNKQGVSADALIGNLLDKKDTFTPKQNLASKLSADSSHAFQGFPSGTTPTVTSQVSEDLPVWLNPNSSRLPPIYSHIWSLVCDPVSGGKFVDTNKILALLLTSSLPKEILGFIWNLATNGANNRLNQQQLYIALSLVALAQMGCTFNNLGVLNYMPQPPIPSFNMNFPKMDSDGRATRSDLNAKPAQSFTSVTSAHAFSANPVLSATSLPAVSISKPLVHNSATPLTDENDDDEFGDFTDYQSAEVITVQPQSSFSSTSSLPSTAVVQPSIAAKQVMTDFNHSVVSKFGGSHGRSIGSRLANYSLGAPKSHVSSQKNQKSIENNNSYMDDEVIFSNTSLDEQPRHHMSLPDTSNSDDFSDFQIAAGLSVNVDELFPKCNPKCTQKTILKESAIRGASEEEFHSQKFEELLTLDSPSDNSVKNIPILSPPAKPSKELMSVEEDKYSALRFIAIENKPSIASDFGTVSPGEADEFGDFISADDFFTEIASRDTINQTTHLKLAQNVDWQTTTPQTLEFPVSSWDGETRKELSSIPQQSLVCDTNLSSCTGNVDDVMSSALSSLDFHEEKSLSASKSKELAGWSFEFDFEQQPSPQNSNTVVNTAIIEEDDEFGDFVGPQTSPAVDKPSSVLLNDPSWVEDSSNKLGPGLMADNRSVSSLELPTSTLSRHGSLPSLDLNLFPVNDDLNDKTSSSQMSDWIRCLGSCLSLLQAAATTFSSISSHSVLMEVLEATEGRAYLTNLLEVHHISWRIQKSLLQSGQDSNQADSLVQSIKSVWLSLKNTYALANIEMAAENDESEEDSGQPACGVCGRRASHSILEYGGRVYHAPCANLWVNCVERTLPIHSLLL